MVWINRVHLAIRNSTPDETCISFAAYKLMTLPVRLLEVRWNYPVRLGWDLRVTLWYRPARPAQYEQQSHELRFTYGNDGPFNFSAVCISGTLSMLSSCRVMLSAKGTHLRFANLTTHSLYFFDKSSVHMLTGFTFSYSGSKSRQTIQRLFSLRESIPYSCSTEEIFPSLWLSSVWKGSDTLSV